MIPGLARREPRPTKTVCLPARQEPGPTGWLVGRAPSRASWIHDDPLALARQEPRPTKAVCPPARQEPRPTKQAGGQSPIQTKSNTRPLNGQSSMRFTKPWRTGFSCT